MRCPECGLQNCCGGEMSLDIERLTADVERLNALLDVATKMHDRLMDERNKLREDLAQTNAMFKQR